MPDWRSLQHAYGPADDVPGLLAALTPDPEAPVWGEVWSRLCHQGTIYSASFPALPYLLSIATAWPAGDRLMPLALAGSIVVGDPDDGLRAALSSGFETTVAQLTIVTSETLASHPWSLSAFVSLVQALLAFEEEAFWGNRLDCLLDGEFPGVCTGCGGDLYLAVGEYGFFVTSQECVNRPNTPRHSISPAAPGTLTGIGARLHALAEAHSQDLLLQWLPYLFGNAHCPACGAPVSVAAAAVLAV